MLALAEIFGELLMLKIVYQGVAGAYSHIAAQNIYPGQDYLPCETFEQAMDMVQKNLADVAVIPVEIYGLEILKSNIENDGNNTTRFLVMSRESQIPEDDGGRFITSCVFRVKSIPAALYKALGGFATNGINLTKLESYQVDGRFVSARFYMEIESHPARSAFQNAFDELRFFADELHMLGTYAASPFREKKYD